MKVTVEHRALLRLERPVLVEDEVAERVGDERVADLLVRLHPVRVVADDQVGARSGGRARELALALPIGWRVYSTPQCGRTMTTSATLPARLATSSAIVAGSSGAEPAVVAGAE